MEHIPLPKHPRFKQLNFRYYGIEYDRGDFFGYPERRGVDIKGNQFAIIEGQDESRISFYQTWYYFGVLHHFFGSSFKQQDFIREDCDGVKYLTTRNLLGLLNQWQQELGFHAVPFTPDRCEAIIQNISSKFAAIDHVGQDLRQYDLFRTKEEQEKCAKERIHVTGDVHDASLSVRLLCEGLTQAIYWCGDKLLDLLEKSMSDASVTLRNGVLKSGKSKDANANFASRRGETETQEIQKWPKLFDLVDDLMNRTNERSVQSGWFEVGDFSDLFKTGGWCTNDRHKISQALGPSTKLFLAALPVHSLPEEHEHCSENGCIANNIDESTYQTAHYLKDCGGCNFVGPSEGGLKALLDKNQIPVVVFRVSVEWRKVRFAVTRVGDDIRLLGLRPAKKICEEVHAISHVWSDGMGNTKGNSLPKCQLIFLLTRSFHRIIFNKPDKFDKYKAKKTFTISIGLWIDTLCVPRSDLVYRKKAIKSIDSVFSQVDYVLVWDKGLLRNPKRSAIETLIRWKYSAWNRRLWTFHEAINTNVAEGKLCVVLDDGVFSYQILFAETRNDMKSNIHCHSLFAFLEGNFDDPFTWAPFLQGRNVPKDGSEASGQRLIPKEPTPLIRDAEILCLREKFGWARIQMSWRSGHADRDGAEIEESRRVSALHALWGALSLRSTSKERDLVVVVAAIFNIPIDAILQQETTENQLGELYRYFETFPRSVVFAPSKKLEAESWRWAPATFDNQSWGSMDRRDLEVRAERTTQGLKFDCGGVIFPKNCYPSKLPFTLIASCRSDPHGQRTILTLYEVRRIRQTGSLSKTKPPDLIWRAFCNDAKKKEERLCLLARELGHEGVGESYDQLEPYLSGEDPETTKMHGQDTVVVALKKVSPDDKEGLTYATLGPCVFVFKRLIYADAIDTISRRGSFSAEPSLYIDREYVRGSAAFAEGTPHWSEVGEARKRWVYKPEFWKALEMNVEFLKAGGIKGPFRDPQDLPDRIDAERAKILTFCVG